MTMLELLRKERIGSNELARFFRMDYEALCYNIEELLYEIDVDIDSRSEVIDGENVIYMSRPEALAFVANYDDKLRYAMALRLLELDPVDMGVPGGATLQ